MLICCCINNAYTYSIFVELPFFKIERGKRYNFKRARFLFLIDILQIRAQRIKWAGHNCENWQEKACEAGFGTYLIDAWLSACWVPQVSLLCLVCQIPLEYYLGCFPNSFSKAAAENFLAEERGFCIGTVYKKGFELLLTSGDLRDLSRGLWRFDILQFSFWDSWGNTLTPLWNYYCWEHWNICQNCREQHLCGVRFKCKVQISRISVDMWNHFCLNQFVTLVQLGTVQLCWVDTNIKPRVMSRS